MAVQPFRLVGSQTVKVCAAPNVVDTDFHRFPGVDHIVDVVGTAGATGRDDPQIAMRRSFGRLLRHGDTLLSGQGVDLVSCGWNVSTRYAYIEQTHILVR